MASAWAILLVIIPLCGAKGVDVFTAGESGYYCIKIPALLVTNRGTLLAFGEGRYHNCSDYTKTDLVFKRSTSMGANWCYCTRGDAHPQDRSRRGAF
jgi:sialidase-1